MRTHSPGKSPATGEARGPVRPAVTAPATNAASPPSPVRLALLRGAGNADVVQMLRQSGHPGTHSAEEAPHGAVEGHERPGQAPVQRSAVPDVLRSGGRPLDDATRTDMESRLGADFSTVRIHDDAAARRSAAEIGARAYTSGDHVVIGDGGGDRHTLAHELTHVIQQRLGPVAGTDNGSGLRVSDPADRFEREAEANARRALSGRASVREASGPDPAQRSVRTGAVQRVVQDPENIQDLWTHRYWQEQAGNSAAQAPKASGSRRELPTVLKDVARKLLRDLRNAGPQEKELRLFRTMTVEEADAIMKWKGDGKQAGTEEWLVGERNRGESAAQNFHHDKNLDGSRVGAMPVKKHLGDMDQAYEYYRRNHDQHYESGPKADNGRVVGGPPTRVLEFTLKPGAHRQLFTPEYMALAGNTGAPDSLRRIHGENSQFETGSGGEGNLTGRVGMKLESHGDFSLSLGSETEATQLLFQLFVKDVQDVTSRASHRWNNETDAY
ncbi:eCIS core domain-containing protein [Streptomyces sp. NPDC055089]